MAFIIFRSVYGQGGASLYIFYDYHGKSASHHVRTPGTLAGANPEEKSIDWKAELWWQPVFST
ncbi:MAG: hypothetical protein DSY80_07580 [Desulfocapsa sp.]|nr:MAG: hypothetical protein DSY80_07580 [Desulfocapsa sp.]